MSSYVLRVNNNVAVPSAAVPSRSEAQCARRAGANVGNTPRERGSGASGGFLRNINTVCSAHNIVWAFRVSMRSSNLSNDLLKCNYGRFWHQSEVKWKFEKMFFVLGGVILIADEERCQQDYSCCLGLTVVWPQGLAGWRVPGLRSCCGLYFVEGHSWCVVVYNLAETAIGWWAQWQQCEVLLS